MSHGFFSFHLFPLWITGDANGLLPFIEITVLGDKVRVLFDVVVVEEDLQALLTVVEVITRFREDVPLKRIGESTLVGKRLRGDAVSFRIKELVTIGHGRVQEVVIRPHLSIGTVCGTGLKRVA